VPVRNRVGEENEGWRMITTQLNHERIGIAAWSGFAQEMWSAVGRWAADTDADAVGGTGEKMIDIPWVRSELARTHAELKAMYLLNWRMAVDLSEGTLSPAASSAVKVFGTERVIEVYRRLLGVVGAVGYLSPGSPGAVIAGRLEQSARQAQINTFGGGVNEIQREIVATAGLGLARTSR